MDPGSWGWRVYLITGEVVIVHARAHRIEGDFISFDDGDGSVCSYRQDLVARVERFDPRGTGTDQADQITT